jgi:hypothetical protein
MKNKLLKALKVLAFLVVGLVTLAALALAIENYRGKRAWEACQAELAARGEKLEWSALLPAPVPDEQNVFKAPLLRPLTEVAPDPATRGTAWGPRDTNAVWRLENLFASLNPAYEVTRASWRLGRFTDLTAIQTALRGETNTRNAELQQFQTTPPGTPPADLLALLGTRAAELAELQSALERPHAQAGLRRPGTLLSDEPHLSVFRGFSRAFGLKAIAELAAGQPDRAAADTVAVFRLARAFEAESVLIDTLVEMAILETGMQPLWEGLARHDWREEHLATFETELGRFDFVAGMARTLRFERAYSLGLLESWRNPSGVSGAAGAGGVPDLAPSPNYLPGGWIRQSQVHIARMFQDFLIPVLDTNRMLIDVPLGNRLGQEAQARLEGWSPYKFMARALFPAINSASQRAAVAQTVVNQARIAVAIERFRLANGTPPDALAALAPRFLAAVPVDVLGGAPYRYEPAGGNRFALVAVGLNLQPDGGQVAVDKQGRPKTTAVAGDWVWQNFAVTNTVTISATPPR